ncbi:MAG: CRTAC1 family protein, partial [Verrucomicrobia bacterium]|nr:CRTAC1 family protein [Verrucomicrobiota bacterium]
MPARDRKSVISGSSFHSKVLELPSRSATSPHEGDAPLPRLVPADPREYSPRLLLRLFLLILGCALGWSSFKIPSHGQPSTTVSNSVRLLSRSPVLSERTQAGFQRLSPDHTGIQFINELSVRQFTTNQIYLNGSGVAAGDVDGDGLTDLYFAAIAGTNRLFRNLGAWKFEDITRSSGTGCEGLASSGAMLADLDGDGDLDLAVTTVGNGLRLFQNNGTGVFQAAGVLNPGRAGMSMAIADVDGDGRLDIYVCNYRMRALRDLPGTNFRVRRENGVLRVAQVNGQSVEESPELAGRFEVNSSGGIIEHGEPDILYRCTGNFQYSEQRFTSGTFQDEDGRPLEKPLYEWGLSVMFRDLNADLLPDLYVCNDFDSPDRIWLNMGRGQFRAAPRRSLRNTPKFSMGVDVADVDRDGLDDILILDMLSREHATRLTRADRGMEATGIGDIDSRIQVTRNTLQWNRGGGVYSEIGSYSGLDASEWAWTPLFLDVDLDGWEDVLISTGHGRDDMHLDYGLALEAARRSRKLSTQEHLDLRTNTPPLLLPQLVFRNLSGLRFQETSREWGLGHTGIVHGMCLADLDNDGDLDVVGNALNGPAMVYQNQASASRVAVRLQGLAGNTRGIGARIRLLGGAVPLQAQEVVGGGRYLSSDDPIRVFAASTNRGKMRLEVDWRSGRRSVVEDVTADRLYLVAEAATSPPVERPVTPPTTPLFEALRLPHVHFEDGFDDFVRQPLLPRRLSQ